MKTLLLPIVLLGLGAALQAQDPLSFPSEELDITGTWYTKAIVASKHLPAKWKIFGKVFPVTVTALEDGTLLAKTTIMVNGRCLEKKAILQKTEEPGKYSAFGGIKQVHIEELPQKDHYIFTCEDQGPGKNFTVAKLMGRDPGENLEALEEFKRFTERKRLLEENIFIPKESDFAETCVPEHN